MKRWILLLAAIMTSPAFCQTKIFPLLSCEVVMPNGKIYVQFGYDNQSANDLVIPIAPVRNYFTPSPGARGQPTAFLVGLHTNAFSVTFDINDTPELIWSLLGVTVRAVNDPQLHLDCPGLGPAGPLEPNQDPSPAVFMTPQFTPLGIGSGQTLRLSFLADPLTPTASPDICSGTLSFVDAKQNPIGPAPMTVSLAPGQSAFLDLVGSSVVALGQHIEVQPRLIASDNISCHASVQVFASNTGVMAVSNGLFQPVVIVNFSPQGLAAGQTLRFNIAAAPTQYCGATLSFTDAASSPLGGTLTTVLSPGTATYLDLPSSSIAGLPGWAGGQIQVLPVMNTVSTSNNSQTNHPSWTMTDTCIASVEIFDTISGLTRVVANPQLVN